MTKLIRYIVVALAVSASAHAAGPRTAPTHRARDCDNAEGQRAATGVQLRRLLLGPLKALADQMAQAENIEDLGEVIWELTDNPEVVRAAFVMGAAAVTLAQGALEDAWTHAQPAEFGDGLEQEVWEAMARLLDKSSRLVEAVGVRGDEQVSPDEAERAFDDFMRVGTSPFAPRGERWYAQGVLRAVVCSMGHLALDTGTLPAWIDSSTLDELTLDALKHAEAGVDLLLSPERGDLRVAQAAHAKAVATAGQARPGTQTPLFDPEPTG